MKETRVQFRASAEDIDLIKSRADAYGMNMSEYLMMLVKADAGAESQRLTASEIAAIREMIKERG